jgi:Zinc dependent phospholipase C
MFFFTHLLIAKELYQTISNEIQLDQHAFLHGNIKPDLPSSNRVHHTLDNCLYKVCGYANHLMEPELPIEDLSIELGEICHYVSDFFCYYHLNEELHNRNLRHFFYEIKLHLHLHWLKFRKKFKFTPQKKEPRENISSIILDMRKLYFSKPKNLNRDIEFALSSSMWICESIIYYRKYSADFLGEVEQALEAFFIMEGGNV